MSSDHRRCDQRLLQVFAITHLRQTNIGYQRIAEALSSHCIFELSALGYVQSCRFAGASIINLAIGGAKPFAEKSEVADTRTCRINRCL